MDRRVLSIFVAGLFFASFAGCDDGTVLEDSRDGKVYRVVELGNDFWMAENLAYAQPGSYCHKDDPAYCEKYGRLYTWAAAMEACPAGWHLPSKDELDGLFAAAGGADIAGRLLKSASGWNGSNGTDGYGFTVLPAGYRGYNGHYYLLGDRANFWSSTKGDSDNAYNVNFHGGRDGGLKSVNTVTYAYSVRCVKNTK